jgi:glycosyltransferase involved in cell wall biosynthesis
MTGTRNRFAFLFDIGIILFLCLLPFIRLGLPIKPYRFTPAEIALLLTALVAFLSLFRNGFGLARSEKFFYICYGLMLSVMAASAVNAGITMRSALEIAAYVWTGLLSFTILRYLRVRGKEAERVIALTLTVVLFAMAVSCIVVLLTGTVNGSPVFSRTHKFRFFFHKSNQTAFFILCAYGLTLLASPAAFPWKSLRVLLGPAVVLLTLATGSRAGTAAAAGLVVIDLVLLALRSGKARRWMIPVVAVSLVVVPIVLLTTGLVVFQRSLSVFSDLLHGQVFDSFRLEMFARAREAIAAHPILGVGPARFQGLWYTHEIHNSFIAFPTENGILGAAVLLVLCAGLVWRLLATSSSVGQAILRIAVLASLSSFAMTHHVLRQRWTWLFIAATMGFTLMKDASRKPRVLLVTCFARQFLLFRMGIIKRLKSAGYEPVLAAPEAPESAQLRSMGLEVRSLPMNRKGMNPFEDFLLFIRFIGLHLRVRPDLCIHYTIKPVIYGSLAAGLSDAKILNAMTGLGYVFTRNNPLSLLVRGLYRMAFSVSDAVVFQNPDDLALLTGLRLLPKRKTHLILGSGVDTEQFAPRPARKAADGPVFLYIGRLLVDKGLREFITAAGEIRKRHPEAQFLVAGWFDEGNPSALSKDEIQSAEQTGTIRHLGDHQDVRPLIADCDVVVLPSYREGVPRSLLEAASMAKPLITTDAPGCRETVEDGVNGFLVPVADAGKLSDAMERMIALTPSQRESMGQAGRERVLKLFADPVVLGAYESLVRKILST